MKHVKIYGVMFLLLALLMTGCSAESLMEEGAKFLDKVFAGDSPRQPVSAEQEPSSPPASEPEPGDRQEPEETEPVTAVEPSISGQSPDSADPDASEQPDPGSSQPSAGEAVTPSHTDATLFGPGESFRLLPEGVSGTYACTYTSEDETIASVDPDTGRITAVSPGTTKVKMHVECGGQYDFSCIVRCSWKEDGREPSLPDEDGEPSLPATSENPPAPADSGVISASHSDATFFNPKEHFRLLPVGAGSGWTCTYATGNAAVATVDEEGLVTAVGPGTTTVTMTLDAGGTDYIFECIVRCSWS